MSDNSKIEWTDATWNPVRGCTKVSPGCKNCYAETFAERWRGVPGHPFEQGFDLRLVPEKLNVPLVWKKPRRIFVNSMSDLFHEDVPDEFIARVFAVMGRARQHTFQVLTKRAERMRALLCDEDFADLVDSCDSMLLEDEDSPIGPGRGWDALNRRTDDERAMPGANLNEGPLPNVWLGVSVESDEYRQRIDELVQVPAAVRFISYEPALGPLNLYPYFEPEIMAFGGTNLKTADAGLHWVICGGESGPGARPMHPDWARSLRDQCAAAGVPFFFKQWGEWIPKSQHGEVWRGDWELLTAKGERFPNTTPWNGRDDQDGEAIMRRVGKKRAGRLLDGVEYNGFPK